MSQGEKLLHGEGIKGNPVYARVGCVPQGKKCTAISQQRLVLSPSPQHESSLNIRKWIKNNGNLGAGALEGRSIRLGDGQKSGQRVVIEGRGKSLERLMGCPSHRGEAASNRRRKAIQSPPAAVNWRTSGSRRDLEVPSKSDKVASTLDVGSCCCGEEMAAGCCGAGGSLETADEQSVAAATEMAGRSSAHHLGRDSSGNCVLMSRGCCSGHSLEEMSGGLSNFPRWQRVVGTGDQGPGTGAVGRTTSCSASSEDATDGFLQFTAALDMTAKDLQHF
ncbi:unnamed protein product [Lampetra planeri]